MDDIKFGSIESAVIAVSGALLLAEESSSAVSDTILLEDGRARSSGLNVGKNNSSIGVGSGSNILLNCTSALLKVVTEGMIVGNISESNIAEEIGSSGLEVPLSEDLINTVEISLTDIELTVALNVAAVNSKVSWDILSQIVEGLSDVVNKLSLRESLLGLLVVSLLDNYIPGVSGLRGKWVRVVVLEAAFEALIRGPLSVTNACLSAVGDGLWG